MFALLVALSLVSVGLAVYAVGLWRRVDDLTWRLEAIEHAAEDPVPGPPVIVVDMRNISEVAMRRTAMAWPLATFAPGVLRTIVLRQTVRQMRSQMAAEGIDAEVVLRRLPAPTTEPSTVEVETA